MLKNNAFGNGAGESPMMSAGQKIIGSSKGFGVDNSFEADKYINDFRLLDIRCGVLEDEKQEYST